MLPDRDKEKYRSSEEKIRRLELKEAKENLWRWRKREESGKEKEKSDEEMKRTKKSKKEGE